MTEEEKAAALKNADKDEDGDEVEGKPPVDDDADAPAPFKAKPKAKAPAAAEDEAEEEEETEEGVKKGASVGVIEAGELFEFLRQMTGEESRKSVELAMSTFDQRIEEVLVKALQGDAVKGVIRRIVGGRINDGFASQNELLSETLEKGITGMGLISKGADLDALARTQAAPTGVVVSTEVVEEGVLVKGATGEGDDAPASILSKGAELIEKGQHLQREKRVAVDGLTDAISERGEGSFTEPTLKKLEAAIAAITKTS